MFVVFIGPPGAGKGTQAERLVKLLNIAHVSTGDLLRQAISQETELGKQASGYMQAGKLVPDELVLQIIGECLKDPKLEPGCLFDGFPRNVDQAKSLDTLLQDRGTPLAMVLELQVDREELVQRLLARKRPDDTPDTISNRLEVYKNETAPVLEYYEKQGLLRKIDGTGTPDEVFARIEATVK
jgi:adenylate kinase